MGNKVTVIGARAGLHILVKINNGMSEYELIETALNKGIKVYPISIYFSSGKDIGDAEILLGFGGLSIDEIEEGIRFLKESWRL